MSAKHLTSLLLAITFILCAGKIPAKDFDKEDFVKRIEKSLVKWSTPGMAIAIIKDDKIVLQKGYGTRKIDENLPVNESTLFSAGSLTKAFTATALAMLVDEGKIRWDDPVVKYIPSFYLFDPYIAQQVSIRDLITHRTGLGGHEGDLLWFKTAYDRKEIIRRIRFLKPSTGFRTTFAYQNVLYLVAAEIIEIVSGKTWDAFLQDRIFLPLGMRSTIPSLPNPQDQKNLAYPHAEINGKTKNVAWMSVDNIAPAGSIVSNVSDMIHWVNFILQCNVHRSKQLITADACKEILSAQIPINHDPILSQLFPDPHFLSYGLGWFLYDYHGRKVVQHLGIINNMSSLISIIPEEHLGIIIFSNLQNNLLPHVISYEIIDEYLGVSGNDWDSRMLKVITQIHEDESTKERKLQEEHILNTKPTLSLGKYAGIYHDDLYGDIIIHHEQNRLSAQLLAVKGDLEHWHYDTFRFIPSDPQLIKPLVTFSINAKGKVNSLQISDITNELFYRNDK